MFSNGLKKSNLKMLKKSNLKMLKKGLRYKMINSPFKISYMS